MKSGIYTITHKSSGRVYLGSTVDFKKRWYNHLSDLRRGVHHSPILQAAWNKYGENAFEFEVVMTCPPNMIWHYEQQHLDHMKPYYNVNPCAGGYQPGHKVSAETRRKQSEKAKARKNPASLYKENSRRFKGEGNPAAKLTSAIVRKIKTLIGKIPNAQIAREYGVTPTMIGHIKSGRKWGHI